MNQTSIHGFKQVIEFMTHVGQQFTHDFLCRSSHLPTMSQGYCKSSPSLVCRLCPSKRMESTKIGDVFLGFTKSHKIIHWLVVGPTPLKNMSSSVGMMTFHSQYMETYNSYVPNHQLKSPLLNPIKVPIKFSIKSWLNKGEKRVHHCGRFPWSQTSRYPTTLNSTEACNEMYPSPKMRPKIHSYGHLLVITDYLYISMGWYIPFLWLWLLVK